MLLKKEGIEISASTVGQVINRLKAKELVKEPENVRLAKMARKRRRKPCYAVRIKIKAIQIDRGSEFMKDFEEAN